MKRLQTLFLGLLIVCSAFGQTVLTESGVVVMGYDTQQPLNIETTCELWLDGKDDQSFTLDGTSVDQWDDKSGNDRHVLNGNADATRPTYNINTGRVTFINANGTFLQSAVFGAALTQPNTVFIVYKITGGLNDNERAFDGIASDHTIYFSSGDFKIFAGADLVDGATDANDNIHVGLFNAANSEYWINGISVADGAVGANSLNGITIGARRNLLAHTDCEIMEVIVYNAEISDVDRDKITGYLAWKWDITATTTFKGYILRQD